MARADDGLTVFVPFTAPGDRVRVRVVDRRRRFARAELSELLEPGPGRGEPRCSFFGRCGGCTWQHLNYRIQIEAKQNIIRDALERIAGLSAPEQIVVTPSPDEYGYRIRSRVLCRSGRFGYRGRSSHALCAVDQCPVLVSPLEAELARLNAGGADSGSRAASQGESEWVMVADTAGAVRSTCLSSNDSGDDGPEGSVSRFDVGGRVLSVSARSFVQANGLLHEVLYQSVLKQVGRGSRVLEIHAGAGFFTLGLVDCFDHVVAVESSPAAVADLRKNLSSWPESRVRILAQRAELVVPGEISLAPDVVLVDPPRAGLSLELLEGIVGLAPTRIVYLSCDSATLARDVARLSERSYRIAHVHGFDLFPQTPHVEVLVSLVAEG